MKKIQFAVALALVLGSSSAYSLSIQNISMRFYDAGGTLNPAGDNDVVAGEVNSTNTGAINSNGLGFFGVQWTATQEMYNDTHGSEQTWAGTSASGAFSYKYTLVENQIAVGLYFNWGASSDIAVLQIFDCPDGAAGACVGIHNDSSDDLVAIAHTDHPGVPGSVMGNGPFAGQHATFFGDTADVFDAKPIAGDDTVGATTDSTNNLDVFSNDTDFEDTTPVATSVTPDATSAQGFALSAQADGSVNYTVTGGYLGPDSFQYTVTDTATPPNVSDPATVNITVSAAANVVPVATDPSATATDEDTPFNIGVNSVATDGDGGPSALTFLAFDALGSSGGAITVNPGNTSLTYTPVTDFNGTETFDFQVSDSVDGSNVATMTVTVNPVNDDPTCPDASLKTDTNTALPINVQTELLDTCADVDVGDTLSLASTTQPLQTGSMLADDGAGTLTYTPATDLSGSDSFTFTVDDGNGGTATATANVEVGTVLSNFSMLNGGGDLVGGTNDIVFDWDESVNTKETDLNFNMTLASQQPFPFFGLVWTAHDIRVFGPGTYAFDTGCTVAELRATGCLAGSGSAANPGATITMTVPLGHVGAHILFDWSTSSNIDVVNVWEAGGVWDRHDGIAENNKLYPGLAGDPPDPTATWAYVSTDVTGYTSVPPEGSPPGTSGTLQVDGNGVNGAPMVDGPFQGFHANFNLVPGGSAEPLEATIITAPETELGDSLLASMDLLGLFAGLMTLLGLRRFNKK